MYFSSMPISTNILLKPKKNMENKILKQFCAFQAT